MLNSLFVTSGNDRGKSYALSDQTITIGRGNDNTIVLDDKEVSRVHCSVFVESSQTYLVDEGSSNGTFINGNPITRSEVYKGDKIRIGRTQFEFNSFLQISLDQENAAPLTASPTKFNPRSLEPTKFIDQTEADTDSASSNPSHRDNDNREDRVANLEKQKAEQRFVQIKNELKFTHQTSLATSQTLNIHQLFHELMELIFDSVPADHGYVFLSNQQTSELETKYVKKREAADNASTKLDDQTSDLEIEVDKAIVDKAIVDYVTKHKVAVLSPAIEPTPLKHNPTEQVVSEVMCVPLQGHDRLIGVLYIASLSSFVTEADLRFNRDNLRMILAMAQQAVAAIENASFLEFQIEKERESALRMICSFMEHRVNNILQGFNGGVHLVEAGLQTERLDLCKKGLEITFNSQARINELVGDLMVLSNPLKLDRKPLDLAELVVQTANSMKSSLNDANLSCQLPPVGQSSVPVDQASIQTCLNYFFGLIIESARYLGTSLEFSILLNQEELQLRVRHPGEPIDSLKNGNLGPKQGACSIAFAIVQKIVQAHDGQVTIGSTCPTKPNSSPKPDCTSEATISLPLKN